MESCNILNSKDTGLQPKNVKFVASASIYSQ